MPRLNRIMRAFVSLTVATAVSLVAFADRAVAAGPLTTVHIAGEAFGLLPAPCNCTSGMVIAINVKGRDGLLDGSGTTHASPGATNQLVLSGSVTGSQVVLVGMITQSNVPAIEDSPVRVEADITTGAVRVTLGPLAGGVFRGRTLQFDGSAHVIATSN